MQFGRVERCVDFFGAKKSRIIDFCSVEVVCLKSESCTF